MQEWGCRGERIGILSTKGSAQKDWAYLSQDCLVPAEGKTVRKVSRVITIERRVGENTSELVRVPVADLAQR